MKLSSLAARLRAIYRPDDLHAEMLEEFSSHVEMKAADLTARGLAPDQARKLALQAFGSAGKIGEQGYDVRGAGLLEELYSETRFAFRLMRKHWLKTVVLVATLALGIGVNTAVFGVVNSVLLQPLPFRQAQNLFIVHQANHGQINGVSYPHFQDWRAGNHSFSNMAVYSATSATLTGQGDAVIIYGAIASASLFRVLGVDPLRGRLFYDVEDRFVSGGKTAGPILISDALWQSRFGRRFDIVGQLVHLDGKSFEVIGVVSSRLAFPLQKDRIDYWSTVALDADPSLYGGSIPVSRGYPRYDGAVARLKPGVTAEQARQDMTLLATQIAREHPKFTSSNEVAVISALDEVVGHTSRTMLLIVYGAVFCVLAVACINVANILLVAALARRREFSLRIALGAPMVKIVRQLLIESILIAMAGGLSGIALAWFVLQLFLTFAPPETPRLADVHLHAGVFLYVAAISLVSGVLFGCLPVLATRRLALNTSLKQSARAVTHSNGFSQPGSLLICGQIILSMVLTCCAGLLVDNFNRILHAPRGFNPHNVLTATVSLPAARYGRGSARVLAYYRSLLDQLSSVPGVQVATMAEVLPLSSQSNSTTMSIAGKSIPGLPATDLRFVDASYFKALQIPLLSGRLFDQSDTPERSGCVVVNQAFVRRFLPDTNVYGGKIRLGWGGEGAKAIVGVVGDLRPSATSPVTQPEVYVPFTQFPLNDMSIVLRTSGDPHALAAALRNTARRLDSSVPVDRIRTLDDYLLISSSQQQFLMWLLLAFAAATVLLSAIGLFGVLSDSVLSRAHEFGIRLALGSSTSKVVALVFSHGLSVTLTGAALGGIAAVFASRLLQHWLYESAPNNSAFFASSAILLLVALAACVVPAHKAANIDPVALLRAD